jgi:hypothetical protein
MPVSPALCYILGVNPVEPAVADRIRKLHAEGIGYPALAQRFGMAVSSVCRIAHADRVCDAGVEDNIVKHIKYSRDLAHGNVWRCGQRGCKVSRNTLRSIQRHWKLKHSRKP